MLALLGVEIITRAPSNADDRPGSDKAKLYLKLTAVFFILWLKSNSRFVQIHVNGCS